MNCSFDQKLDAYFDGELDAPQREQIERHLSGCDPCTRRLAALAAVSRLFAAVERPGPSPASMSRFHRKVDGLMEQDVLRLARAMSAIAASVVVAGSIWLTRAPRVPESPPPWVGITAPSIVDSPSPETRTPVAQWYLADASDHSDPGY